MGAVSALILPLSAISLDEPIHHDTQRAAMLVNLYTGEPVAFEDMMDHLSEVKSPIVASATALPVIIVYNTKQSPHSWHGASRWLWVWK
jgi:hypothetical protein